MPRSAPRFLASLLLVALSLVCVTLRAGGASIGEATPQQKKVASQEYLLGRKALDAKKYDEAIEHFKKSYDTVASPNSRFMVARVMRDQGRKAEAYEEARAVARESEEASVKDPKYADTTTAARTMAEELSKELGRVTLEIDAPEGSTLRIGDRTIERGDWHGNIMVDPGTHTAVLETPKKSYEKELSVTAGETATLTMPPPEEKTVEEPAGGEVSAEGSVDTEGSGVDPDTLRTAGFVCLGVGVVGGVLFGVFGGLALSTFNDLEDTCPNKRCAPAQQEDADRGDNYQTVANVGLVVGIVGIAAGAGLVIASFVVDGGDEEKDEAKLLVGPGGLGVQLSF